MISHFEELLLEGVGIHVVLNVDFAQERSKDPDEILFKDFRPPTPFGGRILRNINVSEKLNKYFYPQLKCTNGIWGRGALNYFNRSNPGTFFQRT